MKLLSKAVAAVLMVCYLLVAGPAISAAHGAVGKWERVVVSHSTSNWSGNPFELVVDGVFQHTASNTTITLPAYYSGSNTWKFGFLPTLTGTWTYTVVSPNAALDGLSGSIDVLESGRTGLLAADPQNPRKWKLADGPYILPMAFRMEFFFENGSASAWQAAVDFLADEVKGHLYDTRLQDEFTGNMIVFDGSPSNHQFDLAVWDQFEQRMNVLADRGRGAYVMFYADDAGAPQWSGKSATEALLLRYAVARLSGYPIILWDTGIDIAEYRSQSDIDWMGAQIRALDPYGHPVSSRKGGGSGSIDMVGRTYDSEGDNQALIGVMTNYLQTTSRPVVMADSFGENRPSRPAKDHRPADIRRAMWKGIMSGGVGIFVRGADGYFHINSIPSDLESEQWIRMVNPFLADRLGETYGAMVPTPSLVSNGYSMADPERSKILYWLAGDDDRFDPGNGGDITLQLTGTIGMYTGVWFDPRTGIESTAGNWAGGSTPVLTPPSSDDWVLLLTRDDQPTDPPESEPVDLNALLVWFLSRSSDEFLE